MGHTNQLVELKLEIISRCPLRCIHCSSESAPERDCAVDVLRVQKLADEFVSLGGSQIQLSGGEPLEHPDLLDILQVLRRKNVAVTLYTSGIRSKNGLISLRSIEAHSLKPYLRSAVFSLEAGSSNVHDVFTRVRGSFDRTVESLSVCQEAGIDVALHFVPTQLNYQSLPSLVELAERLEVKRISLLRFVPHGRGAGDPDSLSLTAAQLLELRQMVERLGRDSGVYLRLGSPFRILHAGSVPACTAGVDKMLVGPDGTAYPCDAFKGFPVDGEGTNVYTDGLEYVWKHSKLFDQVRSLTRTLPASCGGCRYSDSCHGGCLAQRAFGQGKLDDRCCDPSCLRSAECRTPLAPISGATP